MFSQHNSSVISLYVVLIYTLYKCFDIRFKTQMFELKVLHW